jgi:hypothetical protein
VILIHGEYAVEAEYVSFPLGKVVAEARDTNVPGVPAESGAPSMLIVMLVTAV